MGEEVEVAASVTTVIDLSVKVATLCLQYSAAVGNARDDINCLQRQVTNLRTCLERVQKLLDDQQQHDFEASQALVDSLEACKSELARIQNRLNPGGARKAMRRVGLRALKWPLSSKEISKIVSNLERYSQTIMMCLQVDQTTILLDIQQKVQSASLQPCNDRPIDRMPCFSVPFDRDPDFVDRPDITTWLEEQYTNSASRMALVGMGGFGKSQVAIQFAHHVRKEYPQTSVYWVHASSKSRFEAAYRSIAERLELPGRKDPDIDVCGLVHDWLQTEEAGSWLMVLDNADDVNLFHPINTSGDKAVMGFTNENVVAGSDHQPLAVYLPKRCSGTILVTSRSMDAAEKLTGSHKAIYRVSAMDDAQGLQLFKKKLNGDFEEDTATHLLQALNCIPLAVTQAAAYINRRAPRASVKTYLDTFRESDKKKDNLLNRDAGDLRRDETVSNSVVTTWQVTFEQVRRERPTAARLLSFMCFFNPQGIPEFVLRHYDTDLVSHAGISTECSDFEDDLDVLRGYSLVSITAAGDAFEMHALVQFCTRAWITKVGNTEQWRLVFLQSMSRHFPSGEFETWPTCQALFPHVEVILKEEPPSEGLESWAYLLNNCAWYMLDIGNYRQAEVLSKKAVETSTKVLGIEHLHTLRSMTSLATSYRKLGRWNEAEELQMLVINTSMRVLGDEHPTTIVYMTNLATIYAERGRWKDAEGVAIRSMKRMMASLGDDHPETLGCMNDLAIIYSDQGRWAEAEELGVRVMEASKRVLGDEHPSTLRIMGNLAMVYSNSDRFKEAEELELQLVEAKKRVLGGEHPSTLKTMGNLIITYAEQGRLGEAEELGLSVLEMSKRILGEEHQYTLRSMSTMSTIYGQQGRSKESEELEMQVMEVRKRVLGEQHPDTLESVNNRGITFKNQGRIEDAVALMRSCVLGRQQVLGMEHPDTKVSVAFLAEWADASKPL